MIVRGIALDRYNTIRINTIDRARTGLLALSRPRPLGETASRLLVGGVSGRMQAAVRRGGPAHMQTLQMGHEIAQAPGRSTQ